MRSSRYQDGGLRYLRVADSLRRRVIDGTYRSGERLARQHDLAREHNVSFTTLKQALDILEDEGYIVRKAGQGTYAALPDVHPPMALVVDDDESTREFVAAALRSYGWITITACSGIEALKDLETQRFALIFLDLVMPVVDGTAIFRKIRSIDQDVLVVVITAYPDSGLLLQALKVGPIAVMRKPFHLSQLRNILVNVRHTPRMSGAGTVPGGTLVAV